jgi:hypothetical protein
MVRFNYKEEFKEIVTDGFCNRRYAISNFGRLLSFTEKMEDGVILKGGKVEGYRIFGYRVKINDKWVGRQKYVFRLVAENFLSKTSEDQKYVIHLDHNKENDHVDNLRWANQSEVTEHSKTSPRVAEGRIKTVEANLKSKTYKLTATKVKFIKKLLFEPNRKTRLKIIAKRFGVSEMQLHRIKTGENWGHVKYDPNE